jgi:hypothetical protein
VDWTVENGTWAIVGGQLQHDEEATGLKFIRYSNCATSSVTQWVRVTIADWQIHYMGILFRSSSDGTGARYTITKEGNDIYWNVYTVTTLTDGIQNGTLIFGDGDIMGITVYGTGIGTEVRIWKNPVAASPSTYANWDGAADHDLLFENNPSTAADTGTYTGLVSNCDVGSENYFDDFAGGGL